MDIMHPISVVVCVIRIAVSTVYATVVDTSIHVLVIGVVGICELLVVGDSVVVEVLRMPVAVRGAIHVHIGVGFLVVGDPVHVQVNGNSVTFVDIWDSVVVGIPVATCIALFVRVGNAVGVQVVRRRIDGGVAHLLGVRYSVIIEI